MITFNSERLFFKAGFFFVFRSSPSEVFLGNGFLENAANLQEITHAEVRF